MSFLLKIYFLITAVSSALLWVLLLAVYFDNEVFIPPLPRLQETWFGKPEEALSFKAEFKPLITPYKVQIEDDILRDLKLRLKSDLRRVRSPDFPKPLLDTFEYGFNTNYLLSAVGEYWSNSYNWTQQEVMINNMGDHFTTKISGMDLHYLRVTPDISTKAKIIPLLLVHGWPGSFLEFKNIIPYLTNVTGNNEFVFDVIMPSIPGYGFSSAPRRPGFHIGQCARIFHTLMTERLGFKDGFYMQGGDWGSIITTALATLYPNDVTGLHLNFAIGSTPSVPLKHFIAGVSPNSILDALGLQYTPSIQEQFARMLEETGYFHLQATKPDTIGVALNTSPLGLAAYILEKFSSWTRHDNKIYSDGKLLDYYEIDDLLNNVMLYWLTNSITTSMRFYKENFGNNKKNQEEMIGILTNPIKDVPVGVASYSDEMFVFGKEELRGKFRNIIQFTRMDNGGHFAAMEDPKRLYQDIYKFIMKAEHERENRNKIVSGEL